jgi:hypothetical protein
MSANREKLESGANHLFDTGAVDHGIKLALSGGFVELLAQVGR